MKFVDDDDDDDDGISKIASKTLYRKFAKSSRRHHRHDENYFNLVDASSSCLLSAAQTSIGR